MLASSSLFRKWCLSTILTSFICIWSGVGCGPTGANLPPVVNDIAAQTVQPNTEVTISAAAFDPEGSTVTFAWSQLAGGPTVELKNANTATVTFTAPDITDSIELIFVVKVSDGTLITSKEVKVTVSTQAPSLTPTPTLTVTPTPVLTVTPTPTLTPTPTPTITPSLTEGTWYLRAVGVALEDLSGTLGEQVKSSMKVVASENAQDALVDVLDKAKATRFDDSFFQLDINGKAVGTGLYFEAVDPNTYETTAYGFPSIALSTEGLFAEQLQVPIKIRRTGPIIAMHKSVVDGMVQKAQDAIQSLLQQLITESGSDSRNLDAIQGLIQELKTIPVAPNAAGTVAFDKNISFPFYVPRYDSKQKKTVQDKYDLSLKLAGNVDRNQEGDRWEGAVDTFGKLIPAADPNSAETLGVKAAVGLQKLTNASVVYLEPGTGTTVNPGRLTGTWLATFPASLVGKMAPTGAAAYIKLVFDASGNWTDILFGVGSSGTVPAAQEFISLKDVFANPGRMLGMPSQQPLTLPEFRTTLDADGNIRIDMIFTEASIAEIVAISGLSQYVNLDSIVTTQPIDLSYTSNAKQVLKTLDESDLLKFPTMSFIGKINNGNLEGNILFFLLYQEATFVKQ